MFKIVMIMLGAILVASLSIAGYLYYKLSDSEVYITPKAEQGSSQSVDTNTGSDAGATAGTATSDSLPAAGFTIDVSTLPESQQAILETLGFKDTVTFTPDMVSCAEDKLGVARVAEIVNGASPSVIESTKLVPCL